jgi:hypothetical protein
MEDVNHPEAAEELPDGYYSRNFPELGFIGYLADQDVANMPQAQKGMRAARPDKATPILGMYQEKQITHFHEKLDKLLGLKKRG